MVAAHTFTAVNCVGIGLSCKGHVLVALRIAIAETGNRAVNLLPQVFMALPVCHKRVIQLFGRREFLFEADLVDAVEGIRHIADADAGITGGVEHCAAPHDILAGFHAAAEAG